MKIRIDRNGLDVIVGHVTVVIEEKQFKISVDNFDNLVINKTYGTDDDGSIKITPSVSNEIRIT